MNYPQIYIGNNKSYAGGTPSAITKRQVDGSIRLTALGLEGDERAEKRFHGGAEHALYLYPREHYQHWITQFPAQAELFSPPAFGENVSTLGMNEENVYIGDIFRWGDALIQVTQPCSPCYKLNFHFDIRNLSLLMQQSGRCGWLYRIISVGRVSDNSPMTLITRSSEISIAEAISIAFHMPFDEEQYRRLLTTAGLSANWSKTMLTRITQGKIEDSQHRLPDKP